MEQVIVVLIVVCNGIRQGLSDKASSPYIITVPVFAEEIRSLFSCRCGHHHSLSQGDNSLFISPDKDREREMVKMDGAGVS